MKRINTISIFLYFTALLICLLFVNDNIHAQDNAPPLNDTAKVDTTSKVSNVFNPGKGFDLVKGEKGSLNIGGYGLFRYVDQQPVQQSYVDHNGKTINIDTRSDFQLHRVMIFFRGFIYDPKLTYNLTLWNLNATNQIAVIGGITYKFAKQFSLAAGWGGLPGTRSMLYSHPFWLAHDRIMADEYFRPYFTQGLQATGEALPRLFYSASFGNNLSNLGISATQLNRNMAAAATIYWQPTTGEFGEFGSFSDYDEHKKVATNVGVAYTHSRENRYNSDENFNPGNTTIRISDALNLFERHALAPGVTVFDADYNLVSANAGMKYKGFFLQTEWYSRTLNKFNANGPLPMSGLLDQGFYVTAAYMVVPKYFELYSSGSQVWGQFNNANEILGGVNYYPYGKRYFRLNGQVIVVNRSTVSSNFGYYVGGLKGTVIALAASFFL